LPGVLLFGFLMLFAWAARDRFLTAKEVTIVPVLTMRSAVSAEGTPLFKAAGWVEPRPTAVQATALTEGFVKELLVIEGQIVAAGDVLARLVDDDAQLALEQAQATVVLRNAEVDKAKAALSAAKTNVDYPLALQADLAEAEGMLAQAQRELVNLPFQIKAAEAKQKLAEQEYEGKQQASEAVTGRALQRARSELDSARADLAELKQQEPQYAEQVSALTRRRVALSRQLDLKTDLIRTAAETEAMVASAEAMLHQAKVAAKEAQLRLDRMTIRSPIDGKVLALIARPGTRVMGDREAAIVATLYDPKRLQVRADVRLEDVPHLAEGQPVALRTAALEKPLDGRVLQVTSITDIQKNTLQVKIEIPDPPAVLKPEMLVEATFLAPKPAASESAGQERLTTFIPASLIQQTDGGAAVWLVDQAAGVARQKPIKLGIARQGALVEVQGLTPADKVIATGHTSLEDGDRVRIVGEEPIAGDSLNSATAAAPNSSAHGGNQHSK